jgi:hypothetical protein
MIPIAVLNSCTYVSSNLASEVPFHGMSFSILFFN